MLEIYKNGGMYVDLTTFFVRPIPRDLDGFVAGGQMASVEGATVGGDMAIEGGLQRGEDSRGDCSTPTASDKRHRPFIMQVGCFVTIQSSGYMNVFIRVLNRPRKYSLENSPPLHREFYHIFPLKGLQLNLNVITPMLAVSE